jgi:hypothetical protein
MNVNTYDAKPMLDEVLRKNRVYDDGSQLFPRWYEVTPGQFYCGKDWEDAEDTATKTSGISFSKLWGALSDRLVDVTTDNPR